MGLYDVPTFMFLLGFGIGMMLVFICEGFFLFSSSASFD